LITSHLLLILFRRKKVTNSLCFLFTTYISCHNLKYTFSTQCSSKNSTVDSFTYIHLLFNINFTALSLRIFTSSTNISRYVFSQVLQDHESIVTKRWLQESLDIRTFFNYRCLRFMWHWYLVACIIIKNYIHIWYRSCVDSNIQIFISCGSQSNLLPRLYEEYNVVPNYEMFYKKNIESHRKKTQINIDKNLKIINTYLKIINK